MNFLYPNPEAARRAMLMANSRHVFRGKPAKVSDVAKEIGCTAGRLNYLMSQYDCGLDEAADLVLRSAHND